MSAPFCWRNNRINGKGELQANAHVSEGKEWGGYPEEGGLCVHVCAGGVPRHAFAARNKREQFARESSLHVLRNNCANLKRATG